MGSIWFIPGMCTPNNSQCGGTLIGFLLGAAVGLGIAVGVASWVQRLPVPALHSAVTGAADEERERVRNQGWNPNASPVLGYKPLSQVAPLETVLAQHFRGYPQARGSTDGNTSSIDATPANVDKALAGVDSLNGLESGDTLNASVQFMVQIKQQGSFQANGTSAGMHPVDNPSLLRIGPFDTEHEARRALERERAAGRSATLVRMYR